ncbi:hypothetical protein FD755_025576, partial [Muntiacus reevesi]
ITCQAGRLQSLHSLPLYYPEFLVISSKLKETTPQTASVPNKVAPPVSVTSQRFTVQIPPSQSTPVKPVPATTTVQNVLLNPSMIGPKNILITTNMVSSQNTGNESNPLKRKHEDDDDNDTM